MAFTTAKSVLIVDDYTTIRRGLCELFKSETGFAVCGDAENGREAIAKARKLHPDLVVMDFSMPVMNGLDAARILRRLMPDVIIIMFSDYADDLAEQEAQSAGISALVAKAENPKTLIRTARSLFESQAAA